MHQVTVAVAHWERGQGTVGAWRHHVHLSAEMSAAVQRRRPDTRRPLALRNHPPHHCCVLTSINAALSLRAHTHAQNSSHTQLAWQHGTQRRQGHQPSGALDSVMNGAEHKQAGSRRQSFGESSDSENEGGGGGGKSAAAGRANGNGTGASQQQHQSGAGGASPPGAESSAVGSGSEKKKLNRREKRALKSKHRKINKQV